MKLRTKLRMMLLLAAVAATGCSTKETKGDLPVATFTLLARLDEPTNAVKLTAKVPGTWKTTVEKDGSPSFELPGGTSFFPPTLVFLTPAGDDDAALMKNTIRLQFDDADLAAARREDLAGGRVWIAHTRADGHVHARLFIPAPAHKGVVMCVAMLKPELAGQLPDIRTMCESVTVAG
jgi:hypothetical protein